MVMDDYRKIAKSDINLKKGKVVDVIEKRECGEYIHTNKKNTKQTTDVHVTYQFL